MATWIYPYERLFGDVTIKLVGLRVDGEYTTPARAE